MKPQPTEPVQVIFDDSENANRLAYALDKAEAGSQLEREIIAQFLAAHRVAAERAALERAALACEQATIKELGEGATRIKLAAKIRALILAVPDTQTGEK